MNVSGRKQNGRRKAWLVFAAMFLLYVLTGCSADKAERPEEWNGEKESAARVTVVTTLFPYYDFVRQVAGDHVDLSLVIPAGMDSHSFEPTPKDIRLIQDADVLIANGGSMELWLNQVLDSLDTENMDVVFMMDHVDVVAEEVVEGMEDTGEEHHHIHAFEEEEHENHDSGREGKNYKEQGSVYEDESQYEIEYDEHIWTSPVNAVKMVEVIRDTLKEADPENSAAYEASASEYRKKLKALDGEFKAVRAEAIHDMIIMGDKFPLRYFADAYDLRYRAAFSGCSSDTEPSAKTIAYLIDKVREEHLSAIYYLELSSHRVAEIISEETGAQPLLLHSCHNVTRREFEDGVTYLDLMEQNVKNLREGLCK